MAKRPASIRPPVYTPRGIRTPQQPGQPAAKAGAGAAIAGMLPSMMMAGAGLRPEAMLKGKRGGRRGR
jgi:hypothetical protein